MNRNRPFISLARKHRLMRKSRQRSGHSKNNLRLDQNRRIPEGLGDLLIEEVLSLPSSQKADYLKEEVLKKFVSSDTAPSDVRRTRALNKWLATERNNEATNDRLINQHEDYYILPHVQLGEFLEFARAFTRSIIGDTVPESALIGGFSGGASTSRSRTASQPAQKYLGKAHVTERASIWIESLRELCPGWSAFWEDLSIEVVPGNVFFTVPKTADIDRCACKEPDINMFLQKGAGREIRQRLRDFKIDLNDQSKNRDLARLGSISGSLATIDLSSASDSVSVELVRCLLPEMWFAHLDSIRSHITVIDGEEHANEMFSSMGNGFTFELESLLFFVLARSVAYFTGTRGVISVYGDDIIAPTQIYHDLVRVLEWFGFSVNTDKSFYTGPFRESCGGHYINGYDITPFYVKEPIITLSDLMKFCNALRHWSEIPGLGCDPDVFSLWEFASSYVPKRFWGAKDHATRFQLYCPGPANKVLRPDTQRRDSGVGGYIFWLNSTAFRETPLWEFKPIDVCLPLLSKYGLSRDLALRYVRSVRDPVETSFSTSIGSQRMTLRSAKKTVNNSVPAFYQEGCNAE